MMLTLGLLSWTLAAASAGTPAPAAASSAADEVLLRVNGKPLRRAEVMARTWKQYGSAMLNAMADEILVHQAAAELKVKPDAKEVDLRLKRIQDQFKDEATFKERLGALGTSVSEVRVTLEEQVLRETLTKQGMDIKVTDDEVKEFFDVNKEKLGAPDSVRLRHILVGSEKEANDFMLAIKAGADFAKLAAQVSLDSTTKGKGGDLGFVAKGMLNAEVDKMVFALKPGEVGGPVKTEQGYGIFRCEEFSAAQPAVFSAIKTELKQTLITEKTSKAWAGYIQGLREKAKFEPGADTAVVPPL